MALDSKNNIKSVFIVPDVTATAVGTKITPGNAPNGTGTVVVTNVANEVLDTTNVTSFDTIKIVKDRGANLPLQQVRLNIKDIIAYSGACHKPATEQVSFVGYNGTSGSINNLNNNFYIIKLEHVPNAFLYGKRPANYKYGTYQSDSTSTQVEVATGLVKSLIQNFKANRTIDWRVKSEIVNSGAGTAIAGAPTSYNFTKWSKIVTYVGTDPSNVAAGDYLRVGTTTADPVYKVVSVNTTTNTITLDTSFQGETGNILAASMRVVLASGLGANFGVKITGIKQKYDVNRWRQYDKVRFNVLLENFGTTTSTTTAAFDGIGVYEQAANDEYISWGDEGQVFVDQVPPLFREQDANPTATYDVAILGWLNKLPSLIGAGENKGSAIFYIDNSCATQGQALLEALDAWVTTAYPSTPKLYGCNGLTPGVIGTCCEVECA